MKNKNKEEKQKKTGALKIDYEHVFVVLGLIFGILLAFMNPPWQSNDEDRHFLHAYFISEGKILGTPRTDKVGGYLPRNLVETVNSFQGIAFYEGRKIDPSKETLAKQTALDESNKEFYHNFHFRENPLAFIPYSIGIFAGKIINSNPVWLLYFARIAGLLVYLALMYLTIKLTPVFKSVFYLFGLTPMVLYQSSSVTYDMLSNSLSFLMVGIALYYAFTHEGELTWKNLLLFFLLAVAHRFSKNGYYLIPFIFFIVPRNKIGSNAKMAIMFIALAMASVIPSYTWWPLVQSASSGVVIPEMKKDFYVSMSENLSLNLSAPVTFISNIIMNLFHFGKEWMGGVLGRFGYAYAMMPEWFLAIHGIILIIVAFLDSSSKIVFSIYQKMVVAAVAFGSIALIILAFYLTSPVGASMVFGLQGRYFIPAVPVLLLLLYNSMNEKPRIYRQKMLIIGIYAAAALIYTLVFINNYFYI